MAGYSSAGAGVNSQPLNILPRPPPDTTSLASAAQSLLGLPQVKGRWLNIYLAANNSSMKITSAARSVIHSVPNFAWSKITRRGLYLSCLSSSHAAIRLLFPGVAGHEEYWTISTSMCIISVIFGEGPN